MHPGVGVVDPVHRDFMDPEPGTLGEHISSLLRESLIALAAVAAAAVGFG